MNVLWRQFCFPFKNAFELFTRWIHEINPKRLACQINSPRRKWHWPLITITIIITLTMFLILLYWEMQQTSCNHHIICLKRQLAPYTATHSMFSWFFFLTPCSEVQQFSSFETPSPLTALFYSLIYWRLRGPSKSQTEAAGDQKLADTKLQGYKG